MGAVVTMRRADRFVVALGLLLAVAVAAFGWQLFNGPSWPAVGVAMLCGVAAFRTLVAQHRAIRKGTRASVVPSEPVPPENVRVVMVDGREIPVDCVYVGWNDDDSAHEWRVVWTQLELPVSVRIAVLPAHTSVGLMLQAPK